MVDQNVSPQAPTPDNATMMQAFEWYVPADHKHWKRLTWAVEHLKASGIDHIWIPPGCKGSSQEGNGYDIYDLYDLGEYDQKGGKGTKWGNREELNALRDKAVEQNLGIYWDAVLNHKAGADGVEECMAVKVDNNDRTKTISDSYRIGGWLGFNFPGRGDTHSSQKYHWYHFTGTDYDDNNKEKAIYRILGDGKYWSNSVDREKGNFDYLMFADLDYNHPEVKDDVKKWAVWIAQEMKLKGIRFDAVKHFSENFLRELVKSLDEEVGTDWFLVGEFWKDSLEDMKAYLARMDHRFSLFDAPLVYNFSSVSQQEEGDLCQLFEGTLVQAEPVNAVTLVMNHDTQPGQALQAPITGWFKPLAYALILLRYDGYPCVFYGDVYGMRGDNSQPPSCDGKVPDMCLARKLYAYGEQNDYFDFRTCIGWVRRGTHDKKFGLAVVMSSAGPGWKEMYVGEEHKGEVWTDILGWSHNEVVIGDDGKAKFTCPGISVAIWVNKEAEGRDRFGKFDNDIYKV